MVGEATPKPRLLTGDRPTGPLHIGHLLGSLESRVALQDSHECFIIVADLHTLTTRPRKPQIANLPRFVRDVVLDQLAVGVDPQKVTFYLQSAVPAVYDLTLLLEMLMPKARLEGMSSLQNIAEAEAMPGDAMSMGLLAYPVLQAADILMARASVVPIGADNEDHVTFARECATVFNELYGQLFPVPEARISSWPALPGVARGPGGGDHKMSKSTGNAIYLSDSAQEVAEKLHSLQFGEAQRQAPGGPVLLIYARAFMGEDEAAQLAGDLISGTTSLAAAHNVVHRALEARLAPIRARRAELEQEVGLVEEIIVDGTIRAREVANQTLQAVREAMGLEALWSGLVSATHARVKAKRSPY